MKPLRTTTITRELTFDAGHRLVEHEGKCKNVHGHTYRARIEVTAPQLDGQGRVIDFGVLKSVVGGWVDESWDHAFLADERDASMLAMLSTDGSRYVVLPCPPTAENLSRLLADKAAELLEPYGIEVVSVTLWETPNCYATHTRGRE